MPLSETLTTCWHRFQDLLCPSLAEVLGPLNDGHCRLIAVLDLAPPESFVRTNHWHSPGRRQSSRIAIARAFMAKSVYNIPTTRGLIDRVRCDPVLRRLCGWETVGSIPSESTFSRAFAEFAGYEVPERLHDALVTSAYSGTFVWHVSRDATAIHGRERSRKAKPVCEAPKEKRKPGRPRKGEVVEKVPTELQRQRVSSLAEMLARLPTLCDVGRKRNSGGFSESWTGYKLHVDAADGEVPISCILTSASVHDSQVAIPLTRKSDARVTSLYALMDKAYDARDIAEDSLASGHVPIIDVNPRRNKDLKAALKADRLARRKLGIPCPVRERYKHRSTVERVYSAIKDTYGGRHVRVRGHQKVFCHLMFGVVVMTAEQLMRLAAPD